MLSNRAESLDSFFLSYVETRGDNDRVVPAS